MSYSITLADGAKLENVELNGNNFITTEDGIESVLTPANLISVQISDGSMTELRENMILTNLWEQADGTHFIIRDMTSEEKRQMEIDAKLEYIAMMTDVEL